MKILIRHRLPLFESAKKIAAKVRSRTLSICAFLCLPLVSEALVVSIPLTNLAGQNDPYITNISGLEIRIDNWIGAFDSNSDGVSLQDRGGLPLDFSFGERVRILSFTMTANTFNGLDGDEEIRLQNQRNPGATFNIIDFADFRAGTVTLNNQFELDPRPMGTPDSGVLNIFGFNQNMTGDLRISALNVQIIPEAETYALIFGCLILVLVGGDRLRQS